MSIPRLTILLIAGMMFPGTAAMRDPYPLPAVPPNLSVVLYEIAPGQFGTEAEDRKDWRTVLARFGVKIPEKGYALFFKRIRILAVAADSASHEQIAILAE